MTATRMRTRVTTAVVAAVVALTVGAIGAAPASAGHSQLLSTSPEDGAVLAVPPQEIRITYDAPLLEDTDTISLNDEYGNVISSIHPKIEGPSVAMPWPAGTRPGTYQVAYRVVCGDGHPEVGAFTFTVEGAGPSASSTAAGAAAAPASAAPASAAAVVAADSTTPPSDGSSGSLVPLIVGVGILLAGAVALVAAVMVRRRNTPTATAGTS